MNSELIRFIISTVLMVLGMAAVVVAITGVFRFRFVLNRMHCAAMIDTLGVLLILCSLMVAANAPVYILKLLAVLIFIWIGSPIASHLVCRTELLTDKNVDQHMTLPQENEEDLEDDVF